MNCSVMNLNKDISQMEAICNNNIIKIKQYSIYINLFSGINGY